MLYITYCNTRTNKNQHFFCDFFNKNELSFRLVIVYNRDWDNEENYDGKNPGYLWKKDDDPGHQEIYENEELRQMLFGEFVRKKRREKKLSIRVLAEEIGISPVYQSSIETGKRYAPSYEVLQRIAELFKLEGEELALFYDLASESASEKTVPMDIVAYINENEDIRVLIRAARDNKISGDEIRKLISKSKKSKTRG